MFHLGCDIIPLVRHISAREYSWKSCGCLARIYHYVSTAIQRNLLREENSIVTGVSAQLATSRHHPSFPTCPRRKSVFGE
jgi:hypothetical protein